MRKENAAIILGQKVLFIDNVRYCFPNQGRNNIDDWGVLEDYKNKLYSLDEINILITDLFRLQPYLPGATDIEVTICWKVDDLQGFHHILNFKNYYYETENRDPSLVLKCRFKG